jgi:hypothetical protein
MIWSFYQTEQFYCFHFIYSDSIHLPESLDRLSHSPSDTSPSSFVLLFSSLWSILTYTSTAIHPTLYLTVKSGTQTLSCTVRRLTVEIRTFFSEHPTPNRNALFLNFSCSTALCFQADYLQSPLCWTTSKQRCENTKLYSIRYHRQTSSP